MSILIPQKLQQCFEVTSTKEDGENCLINGKLTCCGDHSFEVFVVGEIKRGVFSGTHLSPEDDTIVLEARCKKCGKTISVFDSRCDGYDHCGAGRQTPIATKPFNCARCGDSSFLIHIRYEYPSVQELKELGIEAADRAFTWIWVTLECSRCGTSYRDFISYETA